MKYDDASWHYGADFPKELPESAGATHIAMFLSWAVLNGLMGEIHATEFPDELIKLRQRDTTPGEWFLNVCDGKFTDEDLNEQGNRFASSYYRNDDAFNAATGSYLFDYSQAFSRNKTLFSEEGSLYHVPDTWETFAVIVPIIETRYATWRNSS